VRHAFEEAQRHQPCVLFLDEVDSLLESRDAASAGAVKEDRDLVKALLTLMVDIRPSRVLLMAATNHLDRLDAAAIPRRSGRGGPTSKSRFQPPIMRLASAWSSRGCASPCLMLSFTAR